jgi:carbonic anhydrase
MKDSPPPVDTIRLLRSGNERYVSMGGTALDRTIEIEDVADASPVAAVVVCSDLRPIPEHLFGLRPGAFCVMQTPANTVGDAEVAGTLLARENDGISLVVVLGHSFCSVIEIVKAMTSSALGALSREIHQSRANLCEGAADSSQMSTTSIAKSHVLRMAEVLRDRLGEGSGITVVAALLEDATGEVEFL